MLSAKKELFTSAGGGYQISRSVRLRSSASAYFNRTPASAGNRKTWTWSGWVKLGVLGTDRVLFSATNGTTFDQLRYSSSNNSLQLSLNNGTYNINTSALFRDPSSWYHVLFYCDTTNATNTERIQIWVNGIRQAVTSATYPVLNYDTYVNSTNAHQIGRVSTSGYFDGYMTEVNFLDGVSTNANAFGETNAVTGVWQPKKYAGTYGTNGFYLNFSDNSAVTTSSNVGIGKDFSGNGNYWTSNSISVSAGATYDSMLDVPTLYADGGNGRGNYAVGNPVYTDAAVSATWTNGNLTWSCPNVGSGKSTISVKTGKWYWEVIYLTNAFMTGVSDAASVGRYNNSIVYQSDGTKGINGSFTAYGATYTNGDVIGVALDMDGGTVTFYKNNSSQGSISLSLASITDATALVIGGGGFSNTGNWNFGQRPFSYTPPTGFVALNTQNLPTPTISKGNQYFDVVTRSGTGATYTKTGLGFQPDFAWTKLRNTAYNHYLQDSVRGVAKQLSSDTTSAEQSIATAYTSFNSDGYTLGNSTAVNDALYTYVDWLWNAGGSTVTNTSGTISAQVRANPTAGFSVVTYTGTGANATVGHGLNATPAMIMVKNRDSGAIGGAVYHTSLGATKYLKLFQTTTGTDGQATDNTAWNGGSPTFNSSVFSVGSLNRTNSSQQMVAYCFAAVAGYSAFGSYTGNGDPSGPFVYLGFRPRWVMVKRSDAAGENWIIQDTSRSAYNVPNEYLIANSSAIEAVGTPLFDINSNGFKVRSVGTGMNGNLATYIYMAFAENPFKNSLAR
jgi:hypothetical protein